MCALCGVFLVRRLDRRDRGRDRHRRGTFRHERLHPSRRPTIPQAGTLTLERLAGSTYVLRPTARHPSCPKVAASGSRQRIAQHGDRSSGARLIEVLERIDPGQNALWPRANRIRNVLTASWAVARRPSAAALAVARVAPTACADQRFRRTPDISGTAHIDETWGCCRAVCI